MTHTELAERRHLVDSETSAERDSRCSADDYSNAVKARIAFDREHGTPDSVLFGHCAGKGQKR